MPEDILKQIANLPPERRALLEQMLKKQGVSLGQSLIVPIPRDGDAYPLSFAQQRMWFLDQLSPGQPFYNIPLAMRLSGELDVPALEQALNAVIERHEVLRTTFRQHESDPVQIVAPSLVLDIPVEDLSDLPAGEREAEALKRASGEARMPFDLAAGPLIRARLLRLAADEHIMLLTMHHVISDGWSMGVLVRELAALYQAAVSGQPAALPEMRLQYIDYAAWQRDWLSGDVLDKQLNYWADRLSPEPPPLDLPTDRPRPPVMTNRGDVLTHTLPADVLNGLKALAQQEGATIFMALLASLKVLLARTTGQTDISVGTPIAGRGRAELEGLIGFFVNTLVMRTDLSGGLSFRELLGRVKETALGAYEHQDVPFEMLVERLKPQRDMSRSPFFQVMFALQNTPLQRLEQPGLTLTQLETHSGVATFDLTLSANETPGGALNLLVEYNTDLFDAATIERLMAHYDVLLGGLLDAPDVDITRLPVLTDAERRQIVREWNDTAAPFPADEHIHELFEAQVDATPDAPALIFNGESMSYADLDARANRIAHLLRAHGLEPENLVGVAFDRSFDMIAGLLAVLKAGGAFLPLDPSYPPERLSYMIEDAGVKLVLTHSGLLDSVTDHSAELLPLDTLTGEIDAQPADRLPHKGGADALAYVIYTSGSTGKPKGALLEHRSLVNLCTSYSDVVGLGPQRRVMQFFAFGFDGSLMEIFPTLISGAVLVLAPRETLMSPPDLHALLDAEAMTDIIMPPAMLALLPHEGLPAVQWVGYGGDSLPLEHAARWLEGRRMLNIYGPTETCVASNWHEVTEADITAGRLPIGGPIPNYSVYILDVHGQPVPVGTPGELFIGGVGVARGYLNRPELTAERFVDDPFSDAPGAKLYKTGDLARWLPDGTVEFLGRNDFQVKIRGFRVEMEEIQNALVAHPAIAQAVVTAQGSGPEEKWLAAYLVADAGTEEEIPPVGDLRVFLQLTLPDYMIPAAFIVLDEMPLSPAGKIDRKALPAPDQSALDFTAEYVAPRTPSERIVASLFEQVLGVEQAGAHDDFFALGGHSLLATQLITRARAVFEVDLPLRLLFEHSTVAGFAAVVEGEGGSLAQIAPPIEPVVRGGELPLSFAQQRLWFLDQFEPGSHAYNIPMAVKLSGPLNVDVLRRALDEIVARHEVLRTTFPTVDGRAQQSIADELTLDLPLVDLTDIPADEREAEAERIAGQEAQTPFDLAAGPLLRGSLLRLAEDEHVAVLVMHHIVSDGWSNGVMMRELAALYQAYLAEQPSPLPDLDVQYVDFAAWQRDWLRGDVLDAQLDYWKTQLGGAPPLLELPTDRPRPAVMTERGAFRTFLVPDDLAGRVRDLSRDEGATPFMVLLAAFQSLLSRYSGQDDISVGTPIAGRNRAEIEPLIGFFVNTLVMRSTLDEGTSFRELLSQVRETALGAYAHQDVPFEMLVDAIQPERSTGYSPLFQVMFALQNAPLGDIELPGLTMRTLDVQTGASLFDLSLTMEDGPEGLMGALEYNADLFDASTVDRMAGHFVRLLDGLTADLDAPVSTLPLLGEAERVQIVHEWNDTGTDYPAHLCLHEPFEQQAERQPDAPAIIDGERVVTYAELNARANRIARALRKRGVGPEVLVGLSIERSVDMLAGMLGILKAGGAYLPLDPAYPSDRVSFMLEDSGAGLLLTQAHVLDAMPARPAEVLCVDADWPEIASESGENLPRSASPENLAYVIYTSGSTGKPKGVMVEHRSIVNHGISMGRAFDMTADDRMLQFATINFDGALEEIFPTWWAGGALVLLPGGMLVSGEELEDLIRQTGITTLDMTTAYWHEWVTSMALRNAAPPPSLRLIAVGGEKALAERYARWYELVGDRVRWINTYGPTEGAVVASLYEPGGPVEGEVPIGHPIDNVRLYVLDAQRQPVPVGVPGELYIGGVAVARGYLNRPELTAERFLADPFVDAADARMYKTGDLVRWLPDGEIEFLGRTDHQVKVRGFRVELGEIEAALGQHAAVAENVVLARDGRGASKQLVAYVVTEQAEPPSAAELRGHLAETLPEYMVPSAFVFLDALPLTPGGKVDRRALPEPSAERPDLASEYTAPQSDVEQTLADIWAGVLGVEQVGVHDNFFELGGDSILTIQVVARANAAGLRLSPRQLFEHPTVSGLAQVAGRGPAVQAEQGVVAGDVPLTPIQHWFFEQEIPARHHWNQSLMFEVGAPLDEGALWEAVSALVEHHDALRLTFSQSDAGWQQHNVGLPDDVPFRVMDVRDVPEAEQRGLVQAAAAHVQASLNLTYGPLMHVVYFDRGADGGWLLFVGHHLAVDGVSWRVLLEDFQNAYAQAEAGQAASLPPKTTSFKTWAQKLADYAQSGALDGEIAYWQDVAESTTAPLPLDGPAGENLERDAANLSVELTEAETESLLRDVPAAYRTEINEVLLTALAAAVAEWTGQPGVMVALEGHGREDLFEDVDISRTVGWFTSMYPMRLDVSGIDGPGERLKAVKEQIRAVPNKGINYGLLRYLSGDEAIRETLAAMPEPGISFNYLGQFDGALAEGSPFTPDQSLRGAERSPYGPRGNLIDVTGSIAGGCLRMEWTYNTTLHQRATIQRVADEFIAALRALIEHCAAPEAGGVTPTDFPLSNLDQDKLDKLLGKLK